MTLYYIYYCTTLQTLKTSGRRRGAAAKAGWPKGGGHAIQDLIGTAIGTCMHAYMTVALSGYEANPPILTRLDRHGQCEDARADRRADPSVREP